jgi:hypothetical protein
MSTFLVPIEGLTLSTDWEVGPVVVGPAAAQLQAVRQHPAMLSNVEWFDELVAEQRAGAFAKVEADDLDAWLPARSGG